MDRVQFNGRLDVLHSVQRSMLSIRVSTRWNQMRSSTMPINAAAIVTVNIAMWIVYLTGSAGSIFSGPMQAFINRRP